MDESNTIIVTLLFPGNIDMCCVNKAPMVKLEAEKAYINIFGIVRKDGNIFVQGDYSKYIGGIRQGFKTKNGMFAFPLILLQWIPKEERKHEEFCFVYNLYGKDGNLIGKKRSDNLLKIERDENAIIEMIKPNVVIPLKIQGC